MIRISYTKSLNQQNKPKLPQIETGDTFVQNFPYLEFILYSFQLPDEEASR